MTGKVWLVTSGDYSDYRIVAAFSTEALAAAFAAHSPGSYGQGLADVEEWDLNDELPELVEWLELSAAVLADGSTASETAVVRQKWASESSPFPSRASLVPQRPATYGDLPGVAYVAVGVVGADHERVRKVYSEAMAIARAQADVLLVLMDGMTNYPLVRELVEPLNAGLPWRARMDTEGWGTVQGLLVLTGLDEATASELAYGAATGSAEAIERVDRLLGGVPA